MSIIKRYWNFLHTGIIVLLIAIVFRVMHWPGSEMMLYFSIFYTLVYVGIGIYLVVRDQDKGDFVKGAWVIGMLLCPPITGLAYYHLELKKRNAST